MHWIWRVTLTYRQRIGVCWSLLFTMVNTVLLLVRPSPLLQPIVLEDHYHHLTSTRTTIPAESHTTTQHHARPPSPPRRPRASLRASPKTCARSISNRNPHGGTQPLYTKQSTRRSFFENPGSICNLAITPQPRILRPSDRRPKRRALQWLAQRLHAHQLRKHGQHAMLPLRQTQHTTAIWKGPIR